MQIPGHIEGFQWDKGNRDKNWERHGVAWWECEQVFFNYPLFTHPDLKHSDKEHRHFALGKTDASRLLFLVFTTRGSHIRIISAREMNRKERKVTLKKLKKIPKFASEKEEREFWATQDSTEYVDWKKAKFTLFSDLKASSKTISIRLPESLLENKSNCLRIGGMSPTSRF